MLRLLAAARVRLLPCLLLALLAAPAPARADEGMWTFDNLPLQRIQERYGFTPTPQWLEHLRESAVSFGGASGAFVSPEGLVLTNHHVGLGQLQKVSSEKVDYVRDGFFARTAAEELRCPDLELRVLQSMEDVTARVNAAVDARAAGKIRNEQRRAIMARIEKESRGGPGELCRVVDLYHGGEYWLYRYRRYTDVRLVMAPEQQTAFFGGDPDNFSYPRHDLDITFFRVYENGQPAHPRHWLRWSATGPKEGGLVFTAGQPGTTSRLRTVAQIEYERDCSVPVQISIRERQLQALRRYSARGPEQARRAVDRIFGLENSLKRLRGFRDALADGRIVAARRAAEDSLRARVAADPALSAECGGAWDRVAAAEKEMARRHREYLFRTNFLGIRMVALASDIVRYVTELPKPNAERLTEYRDANLESLRFQMFSPAPLYPDQHEYMLAQALEECRRELGPDNDFVKAALGGREPAEVAHEVIGGTRVAEVAFRRELVQGGAKAVEQSADPLIQWARRVDPAARDLRKWYEDNVESVEALEGGRIARARFALDGKSAYPDATGTLRLSYGKVAGYSQLTTEVPWRTTFLGLYDRSASFDDRPPFDLPGPVAAHRGELDLATPLNFVTTNDIVGGNSGSPVVDRDGECVGVVFDGNVQSFAWDYAYDDRQGRSVAVHSAGILEALRKIYGMGQLADELAGKR